MKRIDLKQLPQEIAELIVASQRERVIVTKDGEPYALVVGVENKDEEDLELEFSPAFWRMIEESRRSTVIVPLKDVLAQLEAEEQHQQRKAAEASP